MASWRAGWRLRPGCGPMTSSARRPGTSSWPATRPMRPSTTPGRPSTRARGWPTTRCSTMCSGRWRCSRRCPRPARGCCAGVCSRCGRPRWTCRATAPSSAQTSTRWPNWPRRRTTTGGAPMRRGGAAHWRNGSPTTPRRKPPRGGPPNGRAGRATTSFDCSRSGCWRWRWHFQGRPAEGRVIAERDAGRGARAGAAPGRGSRA